MTEGGSDERTPLVLSIDKAPKSAGSAGGNVSETVAIYSKIGLGLLVVLIGWTAIVLSSFALIGRVIPRHDREHHFEFEDRSRAYSYFGANKMCGSCAVVLPSEEIRGSGWGKEIDNAKCVVRFNAHEAKAGHLKHDWGSREDIKLVNHNFDNLQKIFEDGCFKKGSTCRRVVVINGEWDPQHPQAGFYQHFMEHHQGVEVVPKRVYDRVVETFNDLPKNVSDPSHLIPSAGFFAMHWLREDVCAKATVYGLPTEEAVNETDWATYRDVDTGVNMYDMHDFKAEHLYIKAMVESGEWDDVTLKYNN